MITLVTGGARSGKSTFAITKAMQGYTNRVFLATATATDDEMRERIARHRQERGEAFVTIEEPFDLEAGLGRIPGETEVVVVDCLTVWLGNLYHGYDSNEEVIHEKITSLVSNLGSVGRDLILVTNEVGSGIVPANAMTRSFRDSAGMLNRLTAEKADDVYLCVCGIPLPVKRR